MPTQKLTNEIITAAIEGFEAQKRRIDAQIAELRSIMTGGDTESAAVPEELPHKRGKFSDATRLRMKEAQQRRWAKLKGEPEQAAPAVVETKPKRQLSEAGRQAIAEAARKRWAAKKESKELPEPKETKKVRGKKATAKKAAAKKLSAKVQVA